MNNIVKSALAILAMGAVMVYTVLNYINGKTDFLLFAVCMVILGFPLMNMINILIQELKNK